MRKLLSFAIILAILLSVNLAYAVQLYTVDNATEVIDNIASLRNNSTLLSTTFDGGDGSQSSPYLISNSEQLLGVASIVENATDAVYFKLTKNINLKNVEWTPIGTKEFPFSGGFDGDGHTISGFKITSPSVDSGLFGVIDGATIKNLLLENITISFEKAGFDPAFSGLLAGRISHSQLNTITTITNVGTTGTIEISNHRYTYAGGIIGTSEISEGTLTISNCYSISDISAESKTETSRVGGITGNVSAASGRVKITISNCFYSGNSTAIGSSNSYCGGVAGLLLGSGNSWSDWVETDANTAELSADEKSVTIKNCFADGSITASSSTRVQAGRICASVSSETEIVNCAYVNTQKVSAIKNGGNSAISDNGTLIVATSENVCDSDFLSSTLAFDMQNTWSVSKSADYPYLKSVIPALAGDLNSDFSVDYDDINIFASYLSGRAVNLNDTQLVNANVYCEATDSNVDLESNLNIKDIIALIQKIA